MLIGELARELGVSTKTLRHYERIGLLPEAGRTENGYRVYGEDAVLQARRIVKLRQLDLSLDAIRGLLLGAPPEDLRPRLVGLLDEQLRAYQLEIAVLQGKQDDLRARCDALLETPSLMSGSCICGFLLDPCRCETEAEDGSTADHDGKILVKRRP